MKSEIAKFYHGFYLRWLQGNNALGYQQRKEILGAEPGIFVWPIKKGSAEDLSVGTQITMEDFYDGEMHSFSWLKELIYTEIWDIPCYIVDNHNHAFACWYDALLSSVFKKWITLLHIDQHSDMGTPASWLSQEDPRSIFDYTNNVLEVWNFIKAWVQSWIIWDVVQIRTQYSLEELINKDFWDFILDIDIDFWAPELSHIDKELSYEFVRKFLPKAKVITIATSPLFIDQEEAIKIIKELLSW